MVDLATKSLLHDKLRFLITVSGVAFAVTLVFVQVGLFMGLLDNASITDLDCAVMAAPRFQSGARPPPFRIARRLGTAPPGTPTQALSPPTVQPARLSRTWAGSEISNMFG